MNKPTAHRLDGGYYLTLHWEKTGSIWLARWV